MTPYDSIIAEAALHRLVIRGLISPGTVYRAHDLAARSGFATESWSDALYRLGGAKILNSTGGADFAVLTLSIFRFGQLLDWQERLALLAVARRRRTMKEIGPPDAMRDPRDVGPLFVELAAAAASACLERAMTTATVSLAPYRAREAGTVADLAAELATLTHDLRYGDIALAQAAIRAYHDRRRRLAPSLCEATEGASLDYSDLKIHHIGRL